MKKRINPFVLLLFLCFGGCTEENTVRSYEEEEALIIKELNYGNLDIKPKLTDILDDLQIAGKGVQNKTVDSDDDFEIDFKKINYLKKGDLETYNFYIKRKKPKDKKVENLYLRSNEEGEFDAYLVKYNFSPEEFETITSVQLEQGGTKFKKVTKKVEITNLKNTTTEGHWLCIELWELVKRPTNHGDLEGISDPNSFEHYEWIWVLISSDCTFIHGDQGTSPSGSGSDTPDEPIEGGGVPTAENTVITEIYASPVLPGVMDRMTLTPDELQYLANNSEEQAAIEHFLETDKRKNGGVLSHEALEFAYLAIKALMEGGEVDFDDGIINYLDGKALCIYNKLMASSTGFNNTIKKFDGEFPVSHLKFDMGDIGTALGITIAPNSSSTSMNSPEYVITIRLNNNDTNSGITKRPNLLLAKTIAHEVIHAEMFRKLLSVLNNGGTISGVTRQDVLEALNGNFPGMYDYFRRHKNWQHQQMATHYRDVLARILQEFDTGNAVPNNQQPAQLYMDLSWEGLKYPSIFTWNNLSQQEKDRINGVIGNYINNHINENCKK